MKVLNKGARDFHTKAGTIKKGALVELDDELGKKLTEDYPGELVDIETASAPFKAEAEKLEAPKAATAKKTTPKLGSGERTEKEAKEAAKALAAEAKEKGVTVELLTKMKRSDELLGKDQLTDAEGDELKKLESEISDATEKK